MTMMALRIILRKVRTDSPRPVRHGSVLLSRASAQRELSNRPNLPRFGIAFDIDGVLLKGREPIGGASNALQQLYEKPVDAAVLRVPYVFLSNGGGITEAAKAAELSKLLAVPVSPDQVIGRRDLEPSPELIDGSTQVLLGHTPFRGLAARYADSRVLAVGKGEPDEVLKSYGFKRVTHIDSYIREFKNIDALASHKPWVQAETDFVERHAETEPVKAVFVVSDPVDWGRDLQVICDVLRSDGHPTRGTEGNQTPIFLAGDDFEYQSSFPVPRLGLGAFRIALQSIYNELPLGPLEYTSFGKPLPSVFRGAEEVLQRIRQHMVRTPDGLSRELLHGLSFPPPLRVDPPKLEPLKTVYMIGDNPASDIKGAKITGEPWFSILTKSGCYQRGRPVNANLLADKVVEDVEEAVQFISEREGMELS